jgi:hypothetical protein
MFKVNFSRVSFFTRQSRHAKEVRQNICLLNQRGFHAVTMDRDLGSRRNARFCPTDNGMMP